MENHVKLWENLNDLIQIHNDRVKGYETALEAVEMQPHIRSVFEKHKEQSEAMASNLQKAVRSIQHNPKMSGTMLGTLHSAWINMKNTIVNQERDALIRDCESIDKATVESYNNLLMNSSVVLPAHIHSTLLKQRTLLQASYDRLGMLEAAYTTEA